MARATCGLLLIGILAFGGCAAKVGSVSGKVTFKDQVIQVGTVTFFAQENRVIFAELDDDGKYLVEGVPVGSAQITIETPNVEPFSTTPGAPPPPPGVVSRAYTRPNIRIPEHYNERTKSGLLLDIQEGPQEFNIILVK